MHRCILLVFAALSGAGLLQGQSASGFTWKDLGAGQLELRENGKPVLVYNYGPQLKPGAPEDRRRCCYIYPLYTPSGVSMLDDFPQDHLHHRGLFWAWPVVEVGGKTYDEWMNMTVKDTELGPARTAITGRDATLEARGAWVIGSNPVVQEHVRLTVSRSQGTSRELEVELTLQATDSPVTLRGSREAAKSYGGFSARFAAREGTILRADGETLSKDEDLTPRRWAELEGIYGGRKAVLRITPDPRDAGAPYQWCLRNYGFVGACFPGKKDGADGFTLEPGHPVTLKFRVRVSD